MNVRMTASHLADEVKNSQRDQRAAGYKRKSAADPAVNRHSAPYHDNPERSCEQDMAGARKTSDNQRLRFRPALRARRNHEWKPVRRNYRVKKSNGEPCGNQRYENDVIHFGRSPIHLVQLSCDRARDQ